MKHCLLCDNDFDSFVIKDGKRHNLQRRKYCLICSPFGQHNTMTLRKDDLGNVIVSNVKGRDEITCTRCFRKYTFDKSKGHGLTLCNSCTANRQRNNFKQRCVSYKGGKCQRCSYDRSLRALKFHHRDPSLKEFSVGGKRSWKWSRVVVELDKCDLLCGNCHDEEHDFLDSIRSKAA
jgi:hypothetical protein